MPQDIGVKDFFEKESVRFDNIYSHEKRSLHRLIDIFFHRTIQRRFELVLEILAPFDGRRILDVGCGSGRYAVEFASRGADRVLGIDFSVNMIELARQSARARHVENRCEFVVADFLKYDSQEFFDAAVAIGFFEYFEDTQSLFDKLAELTRGTVVISFPKLWTLRTFPRMLRYRLRKCYLRFFTRSQICRLVGNSTSAIERFEIKQTDRDYLLVCHTK